MKFLICILTCLFLPYVAWAERTVCKSGENIQDCIDRVEYGEVLLEPGIYLTEQILLQKSNITLIIPSNTTIALSDDAWINPNAKGGVVNAIIYARGSLQRPLKNIHIILNGVIDGKLDTHTAERGGLEGINYAFVHGGSISGSGVIHSVNGDAVDIDASQYVDVSNIKVMDNGGSGIHFGSPRPIVPSMHNLVFNVTSVRNGHLRQRNGFDLSWPNPNGATFVNCIGAENYRNWQIEANGVVVNSTSERGSVEDDVRHGTYAEINGKNKAGIHFFSRRTLNLIRRDINLILGRSVPDYLIGLEY